MSGSTVGSIESSYLDYVVYVKFLEHRSKYGLKNQWLTKLVFLWLINERDITYVGLASISLFRLFIVSQV
jgi:hypothetical protein